MATQQQKPNAQAIGGRLRQFRMGLADFVDDPRLKTLQLFAELTGVSKNNLNNWELGRAVVPPEYIQKLKDMYGVNFLFEWIYGGDDSGLSRRLVSVMRPKPKPLPPSKTEDERPRKSA